MKKSKKGITLVELILCCAIIAMLGGACVAVLASGSTVFNQSSKTANAQLDSDVLQTLMMNNLPSAKSIDVYADEEMIDTVKYMYIDTDNNDYFTVNINGSKTTIRSIVSFEYGIVPAGSQDDARAQFLYKATFDDGFSLSGGYILSNIKYSLVPEEMKLVTSGEDEGESEYVDLSDVPVVFNKPAEGS